MKNKISILFVATTFLFVLCIPTVCLSAQEQRVALVIGNGFTFDSAPSYIGSLLYLSLISSVLGFTCYFALLKRIPAERAAYATVLFPIVALILSTLFEGYKWSPAALGGVVLILIGNALVIGNPRATRVNDK